MKKIFIVGCLLMFAFMVSAQQGGGQRRGMSPEQQAERYATMKKELGLTDDQLTKIKKIDEEFTPKMRELYEKYRDDREKMREEGRKLMKSLILKCANCSKSTEMIVTNLLRKGLN